MAKMSQQQMILDMSKSMTESYFGLKEYYQKKYQKALILFQVGAFFEIYEKENYDEINGISFLLNIILTRRNKNKKVDDKTNCYMLGFPMHSIGKFLPILQQNGFTVIIVEQKGDNRNVQREITDIISPGINFQNQDNNYENNYLVSIFVEIHKNSILVGLSAIDIQTGKILVNQYFNDDKNLLFDDLLKFFKSLNCVELVVYISSNNEDLSEEFKQDNLLRYLDINCVIHHYTEIGSHVSNIQFQNKFYRQMYQHLGINNTQLQPIEFLDMERQQYSSVSLVLLLDFVQNHNQKLIQFLQKPQVLEQEEYLQLEQNTIDQLDIFSSQKQKLRSVFELINNTSTAIGKRLLKFNIQNPITNIEQLEFRYSLIEEVSQFNSQENSQNSKRGHEYLKPFLDGIFDIERLHRKINLQKLQPSSFVDLDYSYEQIKQLIIVIQQSNCKNLKSLLISQTQMQQFDEYISDYKHAFNLEVIKEVNSIKKDNLLNFLSQQEDSLMNQITQYQNELNDIVRFYSDKILKGEKPSNGSRKSVQSYNKYKVPPISIKPNDDIQWMFTSLNRFNILKNNLTEQEVDELDIKYLKSGVKFLKSGMFELSRKLLDLQNQKDETIREFYNKKLAEYSDKYSQLFTAINNFIAQVDVSVSNAKTALLYNYVKPQIDVQEKSFINCKNLRHLLVERLNQNEIYQPNDIQIGVAGVNQIVLHGINGSGKSVLLKAVSLCIILAQSGTFVPCNSLVYSPYRSLLTQVSAKDDIFQSKSSFVAQICQLRNIINRSNKKSIILVDELLSTTEENTAVQIFCAAVKYLSDKNVSLMFSTHLSNLDQISIIKQIKTLRFKHLDIQLNQDGSFVYLRRLKSGTGMTEYGLLVAKTLDLNKDFIDIAEQVKKELQIQDQNPIAPKTLDISPKNKIKKSRYNSKVLLDCCSICQYTPTKDTDQSLQTHHISPQRDSNKNKFIGHFHQNIKQNLCQICVQCHQQIDKSLFIYGYKQTSKGVILDYEKKQNGDLDSKIN